MKRITKKIKDDILYLLISASPSLDHEIVSTRVTPDLRLTYTLLSTYKQTCVHLCTCTHLVGDLLRNDLLFVGQLYADKSLALCAHDLTLFTTNLNQ